MKSFLKKIFQFSLIFILIIIVSSSFNKLSWDRLNLIKVDKNKNILVAGASRAQAAINDSIFNQATNLSDEAEGLFFTKIKLRALINKNPNIDTVLLSIDSRTLDDYRLQISYNDYYLINRISKFSHTFTLNEWRQLMEINMGMTMKGITNSPKYSLKIIKTLLKNRFNGKISNAEIGGFMPLENTINTDTLNDEPQSYHYKLSDFEVNNLFEIISFCNSKRITLIFINIPVHKRFRKTEEYRQGKIIFENFRKENLNYYLYLDFSEETLQDSCYADLIHLNKKGSEIFTKKLKKVLQ